MHRLSQWLSLALLPALLTIPASAQTVNSSDDTVLKQIILFGRHGVRSAALPASTLAAFTNQPYPNFGVPTGYLTANGYTDETLLGSYFRGYLLQEGLLTGNDVLDAKLSYFRANSIQRSNISAQALSKSLLPDAPVSVHSFPLGTADGVFDPIAGGIVTVDRARATQEAAGVFGSGAALASAYSAEYAVIRDALYSNSGGVAQPGEVDPTSIPIPLTVNTSNVETANVINTGGLGDTLYAADPFVMEYTDGLPMSQVAWGALTPAQISQQTRIITEDFAIELETPYLNQLQSSNAAAHILRSMEQAATNTSIPGAFSRVGTKLYVINSSDAYVEGVASLLHMHWLLPGYQPDYCAPGGTLVFELRQSQSTGQYIVRVYYTAQTFDQLRNLTPLNASAPPATQQLLIPNGGNSDMSLDVPFATFEQLLQQAIDLNYVQNPLTEVQPGVLTGVPLS